MRKDRSKKSFPTGKGMAIAVVLGVAAVSVASLTAYNRTMSRLTPTESDTPSQNTWVFEPSESENSSDIPASNSQDNVPKENTPSAPQTEAAEVNSPDDAPAEQVNKPVVSSARNIMPVEGEISHPFSGGELVKSETLGVWKTHDGCDILCTIGTDVKSMSEGVVKEITDDPLWGITVVIDQTNGLEVHYCGLAKELSIKTGQNVREGEVIGKTSDTCQAEILQQPHLHLAVKQGGKWIDPMSVIENAETVNED